MRGGHKVQGFRVQVFSGGNSRNDRQKAERIGAAMKSHFPDQPVYVHFYSPSWKCRIGNYRTQEEARTILTQVKQLGYTSACIVKGTITVQWVKSEKWKVKSEEWRIKGDALKIINY